MEPFPESFELDELVMRQPAESDRQPFIDVLSRSDEIARWTTLPYPYTSQDFDDFLGMDEVRWVVEIDGQPGGVIGTRPDLETATATFGYWLVPHARGRGVITRVGRQVCAMLFDRGFERIVAEVVVGNLASGAALDRIGFTLEGVARSVHAGRCGVGISRFDEQIWSMLPQDVGR